jgi:transcriptional regulator with XRE-family HTH domain
MDRRPNRIKEWREKRHLTQQQLAAKIKCNHTYIGRLETGGRKIKEEWLRKLAKALSVGPEDLLNSDDVMALQADTALLHSLVADMTTEQRRILLELAKTLASKPTSRVS